MRNSSKKNTVTHFIIMPLLPKVHSSVPTSQVHGHSAGLLHQEGLHLLSVPAQADRADKVGTDFAGTVVKGQQELLSLCSVEEGDFSASFVLCDLVYVLQCSYLEELGC